MAVKTARSQGILQMTALCIELATLSGAERRDLANALLRAAWSATLVEVRVLLLDLVLGVDKSVFGADP
jgi:hypothetical protein